MQAATSEETAENHRAGSSGRLTSAYQGHRGPPAAVGELPGAFADAIEPGAELDHDDPVSTCLTARQARFRPHLLDVLPGHPKMPLTRVELPCCCQAESPHVVLRPFHRPLRLLGGFDPEDILQEPLLCGQELFPPEPLRRHPPPEVFALHDHFPGHHRQGPVVLEQVLDEAETPLPPRIPYRV
ncbi:hypothetical protein ACIA74_44570 [Streptomyces sp. NPDC051658]|uniref:hypothetical protein n=1 Tax=Streptomyces sp. NPDC051658 TaxID=3365667 RepID=UPI00379DF300